MKTILIGIAALLLLVTASLAFAASPTWKRVTCTAGTATQVYAGGPYKSLIIKSETPSTTVYIAPGSGISASNAPGYSSALGAIGVVSENSSAQWWCYSTTDTTVSLQVIY
jgi:hypothetical protein